MTGLRDLLAQRRFALCVADDARVLADGEHERHDCQTEARAEVGDVGVGLLDGVVKNAGGDHVVGRAGVIEQQAADLDQVQDEWGAVRRASLACV